MDHNIELDGLRRFSGSVEFEWLCSCAAYPQLRFELTMALGEAIAEHRGVSFQDGDIMLALSRLSWFRRGWMTESIRDQLLRDIRPDTANLVRRVLSSYLLHVAGLSGGASNGAVYTWTIGRNSEPSFFDSLSIMLFATSADVGKDPLFFRFMFGRGLFWLSHLIRCDSPLLRRRLNFFAVQWTIAFLLVISGAAVLALAVTP